MEAREEGRGYATPPAEPSAVSDSVTDVGDPALTIAPPIDIDRGAVLGGRYQVEALIGRGGSGIVLRAFDRVAKIPVAVKILKGDLARDPKWLDRFSRELRLARQIQHPNVCRVFDIGEADGYRFLTMELAGGGTLRDNFQREGVLRPLAERVADIEALISGLAAIHAAGVVHRDVKPDNLLRMDDGRLVLSDFGLATNPSEAPIMTVMVGTPTYMAPEVIMGDAATPRSDVWSLGVVLHQILFGRRPEWSISRGGRSLRIPKDVSPAEKALAIVCGSCLRENPLARPADAQEVKTQFRTARRGGARGLFPRRSARWIGPVLALLVAGAGISAKKAWWARASASSRDSNSVTNTIRASGSASDWSFRSKVIATLDQRIDCLSAIDNGHRVRAVFGNPRNAVDFDIRTGRQQPAMIPTKTFEIGCPSVSSGNQLLFERVGTNGQSEIALLESLEARDARFITYGSAPVWLPNGMEFAFNMDSTHVGVFSVPTMTASVIADNLPTNAGPLLVVQKVVSDDNRRLALRYMDESYNKYVVIHELPSMDVSASWTLDRRASDIGFVRGKDSLIVSYDENGGATFLDLAVGSNDASRLGSIPNRRLLYPTYAGSNLVFLSRAFYSDVWLYSNKGKPTRLTNDGQNSQPSRTLGGDLIVEHRSPDGVQSIRIYFANGEVRDVTTGPRDLTPSFLPNGGGWLYVDATGKAIVRCVANDCAPVYRGKELPRFPVVNPAGQATAFITYSSNPRLRVLVGDDARDLGPAHPDCPPHWADDSRVWILRGPLAAPEWVEIDLITGEATGARASAGTKTAEPYSCPFLGLPPTREKGNLVAALPREDVEIRVAAGL
jgi:serine/threonine-protein kinase